MESLGHTITGKGIMPKEDLVNAIQNLKSLPNKEELIRFIAMAKYYNKFVREFAEMCVNMRNLLRKWVEFVGSDRSEVEFGEIKEKLSKAPRLKNVDPQLQIDASTKD
ncbi:hypothetical protein NDU88_006199 [Pleurodeles waltl]|uniref:Uncharacterized protein n=1 Tax=Pleurodeles waltl TaxID=8319 RepID=A0AAV7UKD0_PLEWA|nr:hypothetical protein NDU88_006199 [Pleurodeles waltl]